MDNNMTHIGRRDIGALTPALAALDRHAPSAWLAVLAFLLPLVAMAAPQRAAQAAASALPAHAASVPSTRVVLLGTTGGPGIKRARSNPASLLIVNGTPYLIDAGAGVLRQLALAGYAPWQVRTIFITHNHMDHNAGLEPLISYSWYSLNQNLGVTDARSPLPPVQIYGPPSTEFLVHTSLQYLSVSERIFQANYADAYAPAASMFVGHDIAKDGVFYDDGKVKAMAVENTHFHFRPGQLAYRKGDKSYSYRFDTPNGSVVFTGDTGPSPAISKLAQGADVLVSEVLDADMLKGQWLTQYHHPLSGETLLHMQREHLTPEEVGKLAAQAHVKMVILYHIVPGLDSETDSTPYTAGVKRYFSGPVIEGSDLMEYDIYSSGAAPHP
ncbi:MAG: MBL fold metallo-hydrolase [Rhodanobacter sp.]